MDQGKILARAKKCTKYYRNGTGIYYKFSAKDTRLIRDYWDRYDKNMNKMQGSAKRRKGNNSESIVDVESESIAEDEQKQTVEDKTKSEASVEDESNPKTFKMTEEHRMNVFEQMMKADYRCCAVPFREGRFKKIRAELIKQNEEYRGLTTIKMKDSFIQKKRYVLKLYVQDKEFDQKTLYESERMVLQYLIRSGITSNAVRLDGFASYESISI